MNEAESRETRRITCPVCPKSCHLVEGEMGQCGVRHVLDGKVEPAFLHRVSAIQIDPMEKKPLYHFLPGEKVLSIGTFGCTMNCGFCQNYPLLISPVEGEGKEIEPPKLVEICKKQGLPAIAFTYNEPFVNYEFVMDTFQIARNHKIKTVLVTNGNVMPGILEKVLPLVDAMNIDLKAFEAGFYQKQGGNFETVKNTIQIAVKAGIHVEICFLVIPGENDDLDLFEKMLIWLREISDTIVLHINRYYPARNYLIAATPEQTLYKMADIAHNYLTYVYIGNLPSAVRSKR